MKILMLSKDIKILDRESPVFARMKDLSGLFDELHIVVIGKKPKQINLAKQDKLLIYNATSFFIFFSLFKAFWKGSAVASKLKKGGNWVTAQDPFETGVLAYLISIFYGLKLQLQVHTDISSLHFRKESALNRFRFALFAWLIERADSIRVVSKKVYEWTVLKYPKKASCSFLLPIFVDASELLSRQSSVDLAKEFPGVSKSVLVVSRLETEKRIDLAIEAFKQASERIPNMILIICGDGSLLTELEDLADKFGIKDQVKFVGWQKDLVPYYRFADCLLVTSAYEGYGMNMAEATICGLPIVATDVGIAKEDGALIISDDPEDISRKIAEALKGDKPTSQGTITFPSKTQYLQNYKETFLC